MNRLTGLRPAGIDVSSKSSPSHSDDDSDVAMSSTETRQINKIDAALRRLESGRFGHCLYCGDQIAVTRLTRDPAIESCNTCDED